MKTRSKYIALPKLLMCVFAIFMILVACKKAVGPDPFVTSPATPPAEPATPGTNAKLYLALGDSYTIGQSVSVAERFPVQAVASLNAQGISTAPPRIIATTGWTTGNLLNTLNAYPPAQNYDFVTLLIGVNNQFQGRTLEEYKTEFSELLGLSIKYAGNKKKRVFVLSIPDYSVTPFASGMNKAKIAMEIDQFNAANKEISLAMGVQYLDITAISRQAANDPGLHAADGLHPSGKQYKLWSDLLVPLIKASL